MRKKWEKRGTDEEEKDPGVCLVGGGGGVPDTDVQIAYQSLSSSKPLHLLQRASSPLASCPTSPFLFPPLPPRVLPLFYVLSPFSLSNLPLQLPSPLHPTCSPNLCRELPLHNRLLSYVPFSFSSSSSSSSCPPSFLLSLSLIFLFNSPLLFTQPVLLPLKCYSINPSTSVCVLLKFKCIS